MGLDVAVLMDPIESISIKKDTSFAMLLEAQRRGHRLIYLTQHSLMIRDGIPHARMRTLKVADNPSAWFELGDEKLARLDELDVILLRKDPPFDSQFLYDTHIMDLAKAAGVLVVNDPQGLRDLNEKLAALLFPQCIPTTLVARSPDELRRFIAAEGDCVLKPLDGMGGRSIFRARRDDDNLNVILETLTMGGTQFALAQRFLPEIAQGDKRILLINGEPIDFALARIPTGSDFRGNLAAGGRGVGQPLTDQDRWIAAQVGPEMRRRGMLFVGIDVIGNHLTEVNVTSPTCVRELDAQFKLNIAGTLFDQIECLRA
ncbi:MAG: glutathione synthase [Lysobacteraceae bacterium]